MKYKILGIPFLHGEFRISKSYRGICRNEIPSLKVNNEAAKRDLDDLYFELAVSEEEIIPIERLIFIKNFFLKFSTEKFELILVKNLTEELPVNENVKFESLGFELVSKELDSMIIFWLRKRIPDFELLYDEFIGNLNDNFLFPNEEIVKKFRSRIMFYTSNLDSRLQQIDFRIVEVFKVYD